MGMMLKAYKYCSDRQTDGARDLMGGGGAQTNLRQLSCTFTDLLLGRVVDGCQGDESADVLSVFLEDNVIPEEGNIVALNTDRTHT